MATTNIIMTMVAFSVAILAARAYLPHFNILGKRDTEVLARGLTLCGIGLFPRMLYWEVLRPRFDVELAFADVAFNGILLMGLYYVLRARWLNIPADQRGGYNIFTAIFYPEKLRIGLGDRK